MKNGSKTFKGISKFIKYQKELCEEDITRRVRLIHEPLIAYWDHICSALMTLGSDTRTTLILGFWPQGRMTVVESDIMFFSNKDVYEEFAMNELYIGPTRN